MYTYYVVFLGTLVIFSYFLMFFKLVIILLAYTTS